MDPGTIALAVATLLATKAAEGAAAEAGKTSWGGLTRLVNSVRSRFSNDREVMAALDRLDANPESQVRAREVAKLLRPRLEANSGLAAELENLVEQAKGDSQLITFITQVQDDARVGQLTNIGSVQSLYLQPPSVN